MAAAYSQDLRQRVLAARDRGLKTKQVADLLLVSTSWVRRVLQRRREHQETTPRPRGGATVVKIDLDQLRQLAQEHPDATARELHALLGVDCSISAVDAALRRAGLSYKKRRSTPPSRTGPTWPSGAATGSTTSPNSTPAG